MQNRIVCFFIEQMRLICVFIVMVLFLTQNILSQEYTDLRLVLDSQKGKSLINIPKGRYFLDIDKGVHYTFNNMKNVTVEGNGSVIICKKQSRAFDIKNCENFTLQNITIDYDPLCFTQGTLDAISDDGRKWEVTLHEGYPVENIYHSKIQFFDPKTMDLKENFYTMHNSDYTFEQSKENLRKLTLTIKRNIPKGVVNVGEYIVFPIMVKNMAQHCIVMESNINQVLKNVTIYGSNMFSIVEHDCDNTHFLNCTITRNPTDNSKSIRRLRSGNGDGIHSKHAVKGPTIDGCRVEFNADDNIAINGRFYPVYKIDKDKKEIFILSRDGAVFQVEPTDEIVVVNNSGPIRGMSKVLSKKNDVASKADLDSCFAKFTIKLQSQENLKYAACIKLDSWVDNLSVGDLVYSSNRTGNNFIVRNNFVGHTRARGILIKASNGIIENNTIEGTQLAAISLSPEFNWLEAGCSNNIVVRNNSIRNCMHASTHPGMTQPGVITVITINASGKVSEAGTSNNITITNNTIDHCPKPYVVATSTTNLTISENKFSNEDILVRKHGTSLGVDPNQPIWVRNVENYIFIP